jgi:hypothetical protein
MAKYTQEYVKVLFFQTYAAGIRIEESRSGKICITSRKNAWNRFLKMLIREKRITSEHAKHLTAPEWTNGK